MNIISQNKEIKIIGRCFEDITLLGAYFIQKEHIYCPPQLVCITLVFEI